MINALLQFSSDRTFVEFHPKTWSEVKNFQTQLSGWIFRGQSCSKWRLETSLERSFKRVSPPISITQCERNVLSRFKRGAHLVTHHLPDPENTVEWLAFIQHYGGPTRLLDFTKSFYIAAFFALETAESDAAIWCLNAPHLERVTKKHFSNIGVDIEETEKLCNWLIDEKKDARTAIDVEPFLLNERLTRQQGLFVMPCSLQVDMETCLFNTISHSNFITNRGEYDKAHLELGSFQSVGQILKIVLPHVLHSEVRADLRCMNVDAANLFPGIDGFTRSLHSLL